MSTGGTAPLKKPLASMCARRYGTALVPRTPPKATPPPKRPVNKAPPPRKSATKAKQPALAEEVCIFCQFCKKRQRLDTEIVEQCRRAEKRKRDAVEYVDLSSEEGSEQDSEDDSEEGSGNDSEDDSKEE